MQEKAFICSKEGFFSAKQPILQANENSLWKIVKAKTSSFTNTF
jgi:hypothetical protein